ncbi:MAG: hypothetical protein COU10_02010 [Candidatus Harrisonbacteria bacterium CG10_big_fil_rev_8_21_14_0_10_45_28]|uniref:Glycosyl transferase family 1 domain-containing protein n=1 Tax=Candidatus Harrisonbacteria bacterium CG10_big_fil_rev_8_21_14_0_10_45_28 TaxID=1974586 RepID=A0A2H0UNA9_9BACT|nr:MAG: hypothetical protein COU10_02010 [Candidatus Harrisonbacteria bacterium CG10_big_fil_rev_8_21_14_0_10_45_28]
MTRYWCGAIQALPIGSLFSAPGPAGRRFFFTAIPICLKFRVPGRTRLKDCCSLYFLRGFPRFSPSASQTGRKEEIRKKLNLPLKIPVILYVGKIYKGKGAFDLLRAFEKISATSEAALVFVGEGKEKILLENYVKEKNIKNAYFTGFKNQSELPGFYAVSDIFVFPSKIDSWGLVVNEAMASGLPVVSASFAGVSYDLIRQDYNGFVYKAGDAEELKIYIEKLAENPALRDKMGKNSLKIISSWNYDACVEGILKALKYVSKS